ncbi:hypothetical protein [Candidatus Clostridium stratigraminis]|uniref:Uncharacterized protein n=1 Tax=Candidatus Clostridium stratigraminis TaxID=3381661 RepID=A0ABW8T4I4_9CLOT
MKAIGNFIKIETANKALTKLLAAGFTDAYIEIDDNNNNIRRNLANKNNGYGLSNLIIDPSEMKQHPLTSVSPFVNVNGGFSEFNDHNYKLIVNADASIIMRAKDLIKSLGGTIEAEALDIGKVHESIGELNEKLKNEGF